MTADEREENDEGGESTVSDDRTASDGGDSDGGDNDGSDNSDGSDGAGTPGTSADEPDRTPAAVVPEHDPLLLDVMLGKLASYLRMVGYDTVYALDRGIEDDEAIRTLAAAEARRLLTRDRDLAARTPGAILLTERDVADQLRELRDAGFRLALPDRPARCGACNGPVERISEAAERPDYAPDSGPLWRCLECGRCFWKGSHWEDVAETLSDL